MCAGRISFGKAIAMTALSDLKPTQKFLVMNLLADAGFDVSDWANYDGEHPASNPKYCYNWSKCSPCVFGFRA
jgi:5-methylcytosine-specific restriction protein A